MDHEYLPSNQQAELFSKIMRKCDYEDEQEKCPQWKARDGKPGYVDLNCFYYRQIWPADNGDGWRCTAPWLAKGELKDD